jgi:hypothetical protein
MTGRLTIFSILFGVFYLAAFYYDLALFRYYPEPGNSTSCVTTTSAW